MSFLFERKTDTQVYPHKPGQAETRQLELSPDLQYVGARDSTTGGILCYLSECTLVGVRGLKPRALMGDVGVPRSIFPAGPNTHPLLFLIARAV